MASNPYQKFFSIPSRNPSLALRRKEGKAVKLEKKLATLKEAFRIYEEFIERYSFVCEKGCSSCCTCNVTATTLEAYFVYQNLVGENKISDIEKAIKAPQKRFQPAITFNRIASLCMRDQDVPDEQCDPSWGHCPFLVENQCVFYPYRPFGCRCMCSSKVCSDGGCAVMPPLLITVNDVFMQFIEHVDVDGYSGNFSDVLIFLSDEKNRHNYEKGERLIVHPKLVSNIPIPVLMVPPEHIQRVQPLVAALHELISD
jgi:hypothetical protein